MTRFLWHPWPPLALALTLVTGSAREGAARQTPAGPASAGRLTQRMASRSDAAMSYARLLPPGYDATRRWPLLVLMDPRGRALHPLARFREAAEQAGWIVFSSYNTASDDPAAPNIRAVNAMLADAQAELSVDTRRIYLAGFSGTARVAWVFGYQLSGSVAGVLGFGGGLQAGASWTDSLLAAAPFDFYGAAGVFDFNHDEMRSLTARLDRLGPASRFEAFAGAHEWPPVETCARAVWWMELRAMRRGLRAVDTAFVEAQLAQRSRAAAALESTSGSELEAARAWRAIAADFTGLHRSREASARTAALGRSVAVRRLQSRETELAEHAAAWVRRMRSHLARARTAPEPLDPGSTAIALALDSLRAEAAPGGDSLSRTSAARLLEMTFTIAAIYEQTHYIARGDTSGALALLDLADLVRPASQLACLQRARARGQPPERCRDRQVLEPLLH